MAVLVESEKSAVIGSAIFPDYVWLATGGKSQMREEKLCVLAGQTVLLFSDAVAYAEWKQRVESMTFCLVMGSDIIERNDTPKLNADHIDIADWIIFQIREGKLLSTANHLVEAERILQLMIEKNPVLQKLIDDLDLVLVGAFPISNDGETSTLRKRAEAKGCGLRTMVCHLYIAHYNYTFRLRGCRLSIGDWDFALITHKALPLTHSGRFYL